MGLFITVFIVSYGLSIVIGRLLITKIVLPQKQSIFSSFQLAIIRALFYTPTLGMGGHGIALLPTALAMVFTESRYFEQMMIPSAVVFMLSLIASFISYSNNISDSSEE